MNTVNYNDAEQLFGAVGTSLKKHTAEIADIVNVYGAKNLLPYPYESTTRITNGITYTDNGDGTIKINGTCVNASAWFYIRPQGLLKDVTDIKTPGTYIFSRGTDALDTLQYYRIYDITVGADLIGADRGDLTFTVTEEQLTHTVTVGCWIKVGKTVNNIVMKPMIRLASIEDDTYVPYAKTNQQLTKETTGLIENVNVLGAKNLIPFNLAKIKSLNTAGTWTDNVYTPSADANVTFTVNSDGTVKITGNNTANVVLKLTADVKTFTQNQNYILSGCPSGGSINTYYLQFTDNDGTSTHYYEDVGNEKEFTYYSPSDWNSITVGLKANAGANGKVFKPMLRLASDPSTAYAPYAKTNKELTDDIASLAARIKAIEDTNHLTYG